LFYIPSVFFEASILSLFASSYRTVSSKICVPGIVGGQGFDEKYNNFTGTFNTKFANQYSDLNHVIGQTVLQESLESPAFR
jgi:hypothetical protein